MCLSKIVKSLRIWPASDGGFSDAIDSVKPLVAEYGIELQQVKTMSYAGRSEYVVRGQSAHIQMDISTEKQGVYLRIAPLVAGGDFHDFGLRAIDLSFIMMCLAPEERYEPKYVRSAEQLREEIERQVGRLIKYGRPFLEGDFSSWSSLMEFAKTQ
ncbi:MAG TPA: hypothetical protein VGK34_03215 [Armatimonadota bacterium]|jgi:hypothetical protein